MPRPARPCSPLLAPAAAPPPPAAFRSATVYTQPSRSLKGNAYSGCVWLDCNLFRAALQVLYSSGTMGTNSVARAGRHSSAEDSRTT